MVIRGVDVEHDPRGPALRTRGAARQAGCGAHETPAERVFSVNGVVRPEVAIAPGEQQFWRVVNASADSYLDLELEGGAFDIVARDGMPLALHA
jgi:FtsP/CotA-like multicopper oxidase with cupredoxin domain